MIADRRPDRLTPRLKELRGFDVSIPTLLEASQAGDAAIGLLVRQALREVYHYHLPLGFTVGSAWVFAINLKLDTPNKFRAHWSLQNSSRGKWGAALKKATLDALEVASWEGLTLLNRIPRCERKMSLQIVRLVPSSREFIRDDDNLAYSRKHATDALKALGLIKEDRREWLATRPIIQDVAPNGTPITVFFLWPAVADLF